MNKVIIFLIMLTFLGCQTKNKETTKISSSKPIADFTLSFGSCNNQAIQNKMWREIVKNKPNVWVWGGDVIYCDTQNMAFMKQNYTKEKTDTAYQTFLKKVPIIGTWDDHDFGINDGGRENVKKER